MQLIPEDFEVQPLETIPIKREEARHQAALVAALRRKWSVIEDLSKRPVVFAVPNGGSRNPAEACNLRVQGLTPGIPDLCLVLPCGEIIWIELKAEDGLLSPTQIALHRHFASLGHEVVVARSVFDALAQLRLRIR